MGIVADLLVRVGADTAAFTSGMAKVNTDVNESSAGFSKMGALVAGAGALAAGAVTGVVAFGIAAVEKTTEAGQAAFQMSEKFGLATDQSSAWLTVARHLGVDSDQLGSGFKFLSKNVEGMNLALQSHAAGARQVTEAQEKLALTQNSYNSALKAFGPNSDKTRSALLALQTEQDRFNKLTTEAGAALGPTGAAFQALGLKVFDSSGKMKSANELMLESADVFAAMPDGIEKTGLAIKVFGKQGMEMLPVLNLGRKGLEDLMAQGKQTGEVMSGPQVEAAHKLFLEQQKLNSEMTGLTTMVGTALMPALAQFIGWLTGTAVPGVVAFAKPWIAELTPAVKSFTGWLLTLGPELKAGFDIFSKLAPFILAIGAAWVLWNVALAITQGVQAVIIGAQFVAGLIAIISKTGLLTAAQWLLNIALDANPIGVVIIAIGLLVAAFVLAYNNIKPFRDFVNGLWADLKGFWDFLNNHTFNFNQSGMPGAGSRGRNPGQAAGGSIPAGWSGWVGERGPEFVTSGGAAYVHNAADSRGMGSGGDTHYNLTINGATDTDPDAIRRMLLRMQFLGSAS